MAKRTLLWYLRSPKDIEVGDDIDQTYYAKGSFDPVGIRLTARTAPTGRPFIVDVKAAGVSLLDSRTRGTLPPELIDHRSSNVAAVKGAAGDAITLTLVQVGNKEPGRGVTVAMEIDES